MTLDLKSQFPQIQQGSIYLDSATRGLLPQVTLDYLGNVNSHTNYTVRKSLHRNARNAEKIYFGTKTFFAEYFGGTAEDYAWSPNGDLAITLSIYSVIEGKEKPLFISSVFEHHSILSPLLHLSNRGRIDLILLETFDEACILESISSKMAEDAIVVLGHTTQVLGLYRDLSSIGDKVRKLGGYTIFDFSRTAGQTRIDLDSSDFGIIDGSIDCLGPAGSGLLFVNPRIRDEMANPFPMSGNVGRVTDTEVEQIRSIERFELGSPDIASMKGLQHSLEFLNEFCPKRESHMDEVMRYLLDRLSELEFATVIDPLQDQYCGNQKRSSILSLNVGFHSHDLALYLDELFNIQVRSGLLCSHPGVISVDLEETVQISTHVYTTKNDIDKLVEGLIHISTMFA